MKEPEARRWEWLLRLAFALLALLVPGLVGYEIYLQLSTPVIDCVLDGQTGLVLDVQQDSLANYAGLMPGDVILSVNSIPLAELTRLPVENYQAQVQRNGQVRDVELPLITMARVNLPSLLSALVVALTYWGAALALLIRRFRRKEIRLVFILGQTIAITLLFPMAHPYAWSMPNRAILALSVASLCLSAPLVLHYYLTFPVSLGTPHHRRWGLAVLYGLALACLANWLWGRLLRSQVVAAYTACVLAVAIGVMGYVYLRRATPDDRRRLRLVVLGTFLAGIPAVLLYLLPSLLDSPSRMPVQWVGLFTIAAPACYIYATARHNLFGIDRLLNRTLVYALLSLGILLLYLGPFLLIYRYLPGDLLAQMMVAAGLTLVVGLGFNWTRARVQRLIDQLFYGGWYDYAGVVETVSDALAHCLEREQLVDVLARQVPEMMQLCVGEVWIGEAGTAPSRETGPARLWFSLAFQGQVRGVWCVGPRRDGESWSDADLRILKTLTRQAETALGNVLLVEALRRRLGEIRQAQHQLLRSREEERSRLARDLHDGPIQSLVGLNMQLGLLLAAPDGNDASFLNDASLRNDVPFLNDAWAKELGTMRAEVRALLTDLRHACAELRPPMLDTLGLGAALRSLVEEWSAQNDTILNLDLPPNATLRGLPGEVAVNLYRIVQEALGNIARHAEARQVTLYLAWKGDCLDLVVRDDGRGFAMPAGLQNLVEEGHFGLAGIQERAALIGSTCSIESAPGKGATVHVTWHTDRLVHDS